ncbi:MAG: bifunctional response regulator/alkaline phosphatase family protein [Rikenellaceae bacterium]
MNKKILWVDDEIEFLKPHILFLENKGYTIEACNNGYDALDLVQNASFGLIILDEMMPGITGLETLPKLKALSPTTPIVMVTKSEEEDIMNRAVGANIADYLIKPVNPNQVLLSIKKNIHKQELYDEITTADYRAEFAQISSSFDTANSFEDWCNIYKKLYHWTLQLEDSNDESIREILVYQKTEANNAFAKYIKHNYIDWFKPKTATKPVLSHTLMKNKVFSLLDKETKTTFLLIDNFRYDQWLIIRPLLSQYFNVDKEEFYCSILPTATQYARNAIFSGLTPLAIDKIMPDQWLNDNEHGAKNQYEEDFLMRQIQGLGKNYRISFDKLIRPEAGRRLLDNMSKVLNADFSVIIYNFLDILSHARTDTDIIRELAEDEAAFRTLTRSWFEHSELFTIMRQLATNGNTIVVTSDHGTMRVDKAIKVVGDKETSANLRYKTGRNLKYNPKEVFVIEHPEDVALPAGNISSQYIFACGSDYLVYPNNYNQHARYYKNTFQHGGVSMEEMLVPFLVLKPKK